MATTLIGLDSVLTQWAGNGPVEDFKPCARYYEAMDVVIYLTEDVSYRADRVDRFLTLLWHPHEQRAIGVKLKGWRHLFERIRSISRSLGKDFPDGAFVPLMAGVEVALTAGMGQTLTGDAKRIRKYEQAKAIVTGVDLNSNEIAYAA